MSNRHRPKIVGFMSLLMIVVGVMQIAAGVVVMLGRNNADMQKALDATSSETSQIGMALIIAGAIGFLVGSALRSGRNWARLLVGFVAVANLVALVWAAFAYHRLHWYNVAWPTLIYSLIAGYLFLDDDAKEYFSGN